MRRRSAIVFMIISGCSEAQLSFDEAIEQILSRSTTIQVQRASLEALRSRNGSTHLRLFPTISARGTQSYSAEMGEPSPSNTRMVELALHLNLLRFGADFAAMSAAGSEERAALLSLEKTTLNVEEQAIGAILTAFGESLETAIQKQIVDLKDEAIRIARERFQRGLLPSQEVDKIVVELGNSSAKLRDNEIALVHAQTRLSSLLSHTDVRMDWPWRSRFAQHTFTLPKFEKTELSKRPDWRSGEASVEASHARRNESFGKIFPSLDAEFTYGYTYAVAQNRAGTNWTGMLKLTVPLFDRLENFGSYRAAVHDLAKSEGELEQIRRLARMELELAQNAFDVSLKSALLRDKTLSVSRKLYQDNLLRFRKGLANANELSLDQTRLYDSELSAVRGWASVHTNFTKLCHAVGRRVGRCL